MNRKFSLRKNQEIAELIHYKQSVGNKYYAVYYRSNGLLHPQIAISVSKKIGNAVVRNYEKRIMREIMRQYLTSLKGTKVLMVVKGKSCDLSYQDKKMQVEKLMNYIIKTGEKNGK